MFEITEYYDSSFNLVIKILNIFQRDHKDFI